MFQSAQKPSKRGRNRTRAAHQHCKYIRSNIVQFSRILGLGLQTSKAGRARKCNPLPVSRAGPAAARSARSCLKVVLCQGRWGCPLPPPAWVSAEAAAERQLVPTDGKGFENESATQESAGGIALCKNQLLISHAGLVLAFIHLFFKVALSIVK